jgi:hypothetical protein
MSTAVRPISQNPRLRIARLMELLVERQQSAQAFLDAHAHTASPSEQIAYALDARLVLHPGAVPAELLAEQRQAALLRAVKQQGGLWKSGRARHLYEALGYGQLSKSTASHDLCALAAAGHLIRHEADGCRFFEPTEGRHA